MPDTTENFEIELPERYANFKDAYYDLVEKADAGMMVIADTESSLDSVLSNDHHNVLGYSKDPGDFYLSNNGDFEPLDVSVDFTELTTTEVNELADQLDGEFLLLAGGTMEGDIDMDGNDINNANTVNANKVDAEGELILPIR